jgi:hypothetical protein
MLIRAVGYFSESTSNFELTIRIRIVFRIAFFLGLIFILLFLFSSDVTLNGNSSPTLSDKLIFTGVGLALWTLLFLPLVGYRRDFANKIMTILSSKKPV